MKNILTAAALATCASPAKAQARRSAAAAPPTERPTRAIRLYLLLLCAFAAAPAAKAQSPLERFPVCEPSAAVLVPCGQAGSSCLLLGDNEEERDLYLYRILNQGSLEPAAENDFSVRLGELEEEVSDIEAIASRGANEILVFGSHGRDRSCNAEGKRRRFLRARYEDGKLEALGEGLVKSKKISCRQLFEKSPQGAILFT